MSQPNGEEWSERRDFASRKIIEHVEKARADLTEALESKLDERLKPHVTWPGIGGAMVALLGLVVTLVFTLSAPVKADVAAERKERMEQNKDMATEFRELRKSMDADRKELNAAVQAIKDVIVEGRARRDAQKDFQRKTGER